LAKSTLVFVASEPTKTGLYVSLSCYYHGYSPSTPIPFLAPWTKTSPFTATGVGCHNDVHIVATSPALTGVTDSTLSNWSCSVHEALDSFPVDWTPLAIAVGTFSGSLTFADNTVGVPYILVSGAVAPILCGDGIKQPTEECDDGNVIATDSCTNLCKKARCGDAVIWSGVEKCDDGNTINTDACTNDCKTAVCGDGIVWAGVEECDDGNAINTDTCPSTCHKAVCGDGFVYIGVEQCDDGNSNNNDGCSNECKFTPPDCSAATLSAPQDWPPNHKFDALYMVGVFDPSGGPLTYTVISVYQDEPVKQTGQGSGSTCPDAQIITNGFAARVERDGTGDGRIYRASFVATSTVSGLSCTKVLTFCIPHDQGNGNTCGDQGPLYNSLGPC
jgi:cysteine-rich repeat protein